MGVVVKLAEAAFKDEDADKAYEFQSDDRSLASFGRTMVCADLMCVLEDWIQGCRQDYGQYNVGTESHEVSKNQGRIEALINFKEFLANLQYLDHEIEEEEK